jgi:hypothetical protein
MECPSFAVKTEPHNEALSNCYLDVIKDVFARSRVFIDALFILSFFLSDCRKSRPRHWAGNYHDDSCLTRADARDRSGANR